MGTVDLTNWEILIVDDEPDNLTVLDTLLNFFDAHVTSANSGEEALQLLKTRKFKLGLFDIQMPKVSGWDLIKFVRENDKPEVREMCVIAVTALAMRGDEERVLQAGFDGYVAKPIDANVFLEALQTILSRPKIIQLPTLHNADPKPEPAPIVESVGISEKMSQVISEARTHSEESGEIDLSNVADLLESNGHLLDIRYELETKENSSDKAVAPQTNGHSQPAQETVATQANLTTSEQHHVNGHNTILSEPAEPAQPVQSAPDPSVNAALPAPTSASDAVQAVQEVK